MTAPDLAAALLKDVKRHSGWHALDPVPVMYEADVIKALTAALDGVDERAGEVLTRRLRKTEEAGHVHHLSKADRLAAADLITALIARRAADAARIRELEAEAAAKQATYDELYADALADAKSDAQDFDGDLWREVRKYLNELELDWRDYQDDGITAEQAVEYIRECMDGETTRAEAAEAKVAALAEQVERMRGALGSIAGSDIQSFMLDAYFGGYKLSDNRRYCDAPDVKRLMDLARAAITEEPK